MKSLILQLVQTFPAVYGTHLHKQPTTYPFPEPKQYSPHPLKRFLLEMGR